MNDIMSDFKSLQKKLYHIWDTISRENQIYPEFYILKTAAILKRRINLYSELFVVNDKRYDKNKFDKFLKFSIEECNRLTASTAYVSFYIVQDKNNIAKLVHDPICYLPEDYLLNSYINNLHQSDIFEEYMIFVIKHEFGHIMDLYNNLKVMNFTDMQNMYQSDIDEKQKLNSDGILTGRDLVRALNNTTLEKSANACVNIDTTRFDELNDLVNDIH